MGGHLSQPHKKSGSSSSSRPILDPENSPRPDSTVNHWATIAATYSKSKDGPRLRPEYLFGYTASTTTNNLFYLSADIVVYPCCAVAVLLNTGSNTQLFLGCADLAAAGHHQVVGAVAVSMDKTVVATGDKGPFPVICCWKPGESLRPIQVLELGEESEGTAILAFSCNSRFLLASDFNISHTISLYDWRNHHCLLTFPSPFLLGLTWSPLSPRFAALSPSSCSLYSYTDHSNSLQVDHFREDATRENSAGPEWLLDGSAVSGDRQGNLVHWLGGGKTIKVHRVLEEGKGITAIRIVKNVIIMGGSDCIIRELNATFRLIREFGIPSIAVSLDICEDAVLVGVRGGTVLEFGRNGRLVLMDSHAAGRLQGMAVDPKTNSTLLTVGTDNKLKAWSLIQHLPLFTILLEVSHSPKSQSSPTALAISPQEPIAVGYSDGHITLRQSQHEPNVIVAVVRPAQAGVGVLQFSEKGEWLAAGSDSGAVYVYQMTAEVTLLCTFQQSFAPIISLYWVSSSLLSLDLSHISHQWSLSQSPDIEAPLWPPLLSHLPSPSSLQVTCAKQANHGPWIAAGNEWGLLELRTPANALPKAYRLHAHSLTSLFWCSDDHQIITSSAADQAVAVWSVRTG